MLRRHHASLLVGSIEDAHAYLETFSKKLGTKLTNNPDYFEFVTPTFGIDEARQVSSLSSRRAFRDNKIFFISSERLTLEAQNALLKTFEDPVAGTYFLLNIREEALVIPTLRSRMQIVRLIQGETLNSVQGLTLYQEASKFLSLPLKKRLEFVKDFVDNENNLSIFLDDLLSLLRKDGKNDEVKKVYELRRFSNDTSALPRLILEHIALVI